MLKSLFSKDYATCDNNDKNDDRQPPDLKTEKLTKYFGSNEIETAEFFFSL